MTNKDLENEFERLTEAAYRRAREGASEKRADDLHIADGLEDGQALYLRPEELSTHLHVIGGSGKGKSYALRQLLGELIGRKRRHGEGFAVVDPHGTLAEYARDVCARELPLLADDIVYLDLKQAEKVVSINPLRRTGQESYFIASCITEGLLKAYGAGQSHDKPLIARVLTNLVEALHYHGLTLADFRYFLHRGKPDRAVLAHLLEQMPETHPVRSFWEHYDQLNPASADAYSMGPANRLDALVRATPLKRMLGQTDASLDFQQLMDQGGIAIFNLAREGTGVTVDGQHQLAALIVQQFRQVIEARSPDAARPFTLVLDEFGDYTSADFARVLTSARKFGVRCVFAHQNLSQLLLKDNDRTLFDAVLAIPGKIIFGGLPYDQAELLARQVYLALLNPDKVKHEVMTVTWDPVPTKVTVRSRSRSGGESESRSEGSTTASGSDATTADTLDADGQPVASSTGGASRDVTTTSEQWGFTSHHAWSETEQEQWITLFEKRIQPGARTYETIDEQVFRYAQELNTNPTSVCILSSADRIPQRARIPRIGEPSVTEQERQKFLKLVYDKPFCISAEDADRLLEEREHKLLDSAQPHVASATAPKKPPRPKKPRKALPPGPEK